MPMSDKIVVFAELRQADVDKSDWQEIWRDIFV